MRIVYLDVLRISAIALVIVNHTLGSFLKGLESIDLTWWVSVVGFFMCKIAVPLFIMISGALLLNRQDSYKKTGSRILRITEALVIFSFLYYITIKSPGNFSIMVFLNGLLTNSLSKMSMYWYLYAYLGLLIMLPLLQKLDSVMKSKDYIYFFCIAFGFVNLWPVLVKFIPELAITPYFQLPLFTSFIGMFFIGKYIAHDLTISKRGVVIACCVLVVCLVFCSISTRYFYDLNGEEKYLVLDDRSITPIVAMAASFFYLVRAATSKIGSKMHEKPATFAKAALCEVACAVFGMYLIHGWFLVWLNPWYESLKAGMPRLAALFVFQCLIFAASFVTTAALRRLPGLRRLL